VTAGLGIYDTMQYVLPPVATWCVGQAASMASLLLTAGSPGMRHSLPNSRIMIHQPSGHAAVSRLGFLHSRFLTDTETNCDTNITLPTPPFQRLFSRYTWVSRFLPWFSSCTCSRRELLLVLLLFKGRFST